MTKSTAARREIQGAAPYDHTGPEARTSLRLRLRANGYTPLPNTGKPCYLKGWPKVEVTEDEIYAWHRQHRPTTGLRLDHLVAFDADTVPPFTARLLAIVEEMAGKTPLERVGNPARSMLIYRADASVIDAGRSYLSSAAYYDGPDDQGDKHQLEVLHGRSQIGAFGRYDIAAGIDYLWPRQSPLDVALADLPAVALKTCYAIRQAADALFQEAGKVPPAPRMHGRGGAWVKRVTTIERDLTLDMQVELERGGCATVATLAECVDDLSARDAGLRCCMAFIRDTADSERSGVIYRTKHGELAIHDHVENITHMLAEGETMRAALARIDRLLNREHRDDCNG
jgi:hypothetical protein